VPAAFPDDLALAERLRARDPEAARQLFAGLGEQMYGYAFRMLRDRSAAEDAFQDAMLGALQSIDRYDGRVALRSWIYGILRNKIADIQRKRGRDLAVSMGDPEEAYWAANGHWSAVRDFSPFDENAEMLAVVRECMDALPHNQREALYLRAVDGLDSDGAAEVLGVSTVNLRQILHRARQNVRKCVEGKIGEEVP
jgi:RNA polymerase sigma-70 factor (ECF subfamily)